MATVTYSGYLFTGIPENTDADQLLVYSSALPGSGFVLENILDYAYSTKTTEYEVNEGLWYKIKFAEARTGWETPLSDPVDGSQILKSAPTLEITSTDDGASYASAQDVYDRSNLTSDDISLSDVNYALTVSKAFIDIRLSTIDIDRYNVFSDTVAKRKFNAFIKLLQDVEINYALSLVYRHMADDEIAIGATPSYETSVSSSDSSSDSSSESSSDSSSDSESTTTSTSTSTSSSTSTSTNISVGQTSLGTTESSTESATDSSSDGSSTGSSLGSSDGSSLGASLGSSDGSSTDYDLDRILQHATYLDALSTRYAARASDLLGTLVPNYVPLRYSENGTGFGRFSRRISLSSGFTFADALILDRLDL